MTRVCILTGKRSMSGHNVSHSNRKTKRQFHPNLQWYTYNAADGISVSLRLSRKGIRTLEKHNRK